MFLFFLIFFGLHNLLLYLRTKLVIIIYVLLTNVEFVKVKICGIFTVLKYQFIVQKKPPYEPQNGAFLTLQYRTDV